MPPRKNTDRTLDLILSHLERLIENQEKLSEEIQKTNIELTKISGLKHTVNDIKDWKESIEKITSIDDLKNIKDFYSKHQDINAEVIDLFAITKELRSDSDDYKKFKTRIATIVAVISFLFTSIIAILTTFSRFKN